MAEFLSIALGYPTLPYSILLGFSVVYWLLAATGLVGDDAFDGGFDIDAGIDAGVDGVEHGAHGISAMFARLGLGGAPLMLVVGLLAFFGWFFTYFAHLIFLQPLPTLLRWGLGTLVAVLALVPAVPLTSLVLRPIRRLLLRLRPVPQRSLLGKLGVVASPQVTDTVGYANVDDGGAGLVLQVRLMQGEPLQRGDRIVLVDYVAELNHYLVVREQDHAMLSLTDSSHPGDKEIHR